MIKTKNISAKQEIPEIKYDSTGRVTINGRWSIKRVDEFLNYLRDWFEPFIANPPEINTIDIRLEYVNNSNTSLLVSLLKKILIIRESSEGPVINWYYEDGDEDIFEYGEYISLVLDTPFTFIRIHEH